MIINNILDKYENTILENTTNILKKTQISHNCMCPNCNEKAINSHTITKKWLNQLNEKNNNTKNTTIKLPEIPILENKYIKYNNDKLTTLKIFCSKCDSKLFNSFELPNSSYDIIKKANMLLYRTLCGKLFIENNKKNTSDNQIIKKDLDIFKIIEKNINKKQQKKRINNLENNIICLEKHKKIMDQYIINNENFNEYVHIFIPIENNNILFSEIFTNINDSKNFIALNYLKDDNKKNYIIISSNIEMYDSILNLTKQFTEKENRILEYILIRGNNIVFSDEFFQNLTTTEKIIIKNLFYNKFNKKREIQNIYDINNKEKNNLINNYYYSDKFYKKILNLEINKNNIFIYKNKEIIKANNILKTINTHIYQIKETNYENAIDKLQFKFSRKNLHYNNITKRYIDYLYQTEQYSKIEKIIKQKIINTKIENLKKNINIYLYLLEKYITINIIKKDILNIITYTETLKIILDYYKINKNNFYKNTIKIIKNLQKISQKEIEETIKIENIDHSNFNEIIKNKLYIQTDNNKLINFTIKEKELTEIEKIEAIKYLKNEKITHHKEILKKINLKEKIEMKLKNDIFVIQPLTIKQINSEIEKTNTILIYSNKEQNENYKIYSFRHGSKLNLLTLEIMDNKIINNFDIENIKNILTKKYPEKLSSNFYIKFTKELISFLYDREIEIPWNKFKYFMDKSKNYFLKIKNIIDIKKDLDYNETIFNNINIKTAKNNRIHIYCLLKLSNQLKTHDNITFDIIINDKIAIGTNKTNKEKIFFILDKENYNQKEINELTNISQQYIQQKEDCVLYHNNKI